MRGGIMREINLIVIHCADTPASMDIGAAEIREWHTEGNNWCDIGYHYVIRRNGIIETGRDTDYDGDIDEEIGAHAAGFNAHSIGICMIGGRGADGKGENNFTEAQWLSLKVLRNDLTSRYGARTVGHRDLDPGKECPSFDVAEWLATL